MAPAQAADPPPPALPGECRAWIEWLVDGNKHYPVIMLHRPVSEKIALVCLGRPHVGPGLATGARDYTLG